MTMIPRDIEGIPVTWRDQPWSDNLRFIKVRERMTIAEVAALLPDEIASRPIALVNDVPVPREQWHLVRLKAPTARNPIIVTFPSTLQGGGGGSGGGKNLLSAIAGIAVLIAAIVVAPYIAGAIGPTLLATFGISAATTLTLTQAVLSVGGALLINALTPAPTNTPEASQAAQGEFKPESSAALQGNTLSRGASIARVCGTLKVFPAFGVNPLQEIVGNDTFVEAAYILAGPHAMTDIRIDGVPIDTIPDVEYETREGFSGESALTLVTRQSKTNPTVVEMSEHKVDPTGGSDLLDQSTPSTSIPVWHPTRFVGSPDEAWLSYRWPTGLLDQNNLGTTVYRPLRLRFKLVGAANWTYVPEIWFSYSRNEGFNKDVRFIWGTPPALPTPPSQNGPVYAFIAVPFRTELVIGTPSPSAAKEYCFDGNTNTGTVASSTNLWVGGNYSTMGARSISYAVVHPYGSTPFWSGGATSVVLQLRASHTAPTLATDGTLLGSVTQTSGTTTTVITSSDSTTLWEYIWINATATGASSVQISDIDFYGGSDWGYLASSYFRSGGSVLNRLMSTASNGNVINIGLFEDRVEVYLDTGTFPKGDYEVQALAGAAVTSNNFIASTYNVSSGDAGYHGAVPVQDFFKWRTTSGVKQVPQSIKNLYFKMVRTRATAVWNSPPIVGHDFAIIAIRAKNQQLGQLSCLASGYTYDWNGSAWATLTTTSNPAPHLWDVLTGAHNADPIPTALMNNTDFVTWRQQCIDKAYTVDAVFEGKTVADVATVLCGCGYARLRPAEKWGVFMDRDRSDEGPTNVYSHKNMSNFHWDKAFPRLPDGFRARFTDAENDYQESEIIVLRPGITDTGKYEDIRYEGLIYEPDVEARAYFDLAQMSARSVFYVGTTNFQHIANRRGDLVALQVDVLDRLGGSSYIVDIQKSGSLITGMTLFGSIPIETGANWGVAIRGLDGSLHIKQIQDPGTTDDYKTITFTNPFTDPGTSVIDSGCLIVSGLVGSEYRRVIVHSIMPKEDTAEIMFVDEAPQLWGSLTARAIIRQLGLDDSLALCLDAGDGASYTSGQLWLDTSGEGIDYYFGVNAIT